MSGRIVPPPARPQSGQPRGHRVVSRIIRVRDWVVKNGSEKRPFRAGGDHENP